jgi:homoserine dehydrogenase
MRPASTVRSRFYLRLIVEDRPGVLAEVAGILAQHQISIASVIQHEVPDEPESEKVQLVIMTHTALTGHFRAACSRLDLLRFVGAPSVYYPVGDER